MQLSSCRAADVTMTRSADQLRVRGLFSVCPHADVMSVLVQGLRPGSGLWLTGACVMFLAVRLRTATQQHAHIKQHSVTPIRTIGIS